MSWFEEKVSWRKACVALMGVCVGMGVRALLQPWLAEAVPFVFAFPCLIAVQVFAGRNAAVCGALLCAIWALVPWLPPSPGLIHIGVFLLASILVALFLDRFLAPRQSDHPHEPPLSPAHDSLWWLRAWIAMSLVLPVVFFCSIGWYTHGQTLQDAQERVDRAALIVHEHASRVIETNGVIVNFMLNELGNQTVEAIREQEEPIHRRLAQLVSGMKQIRSIWIWDAQGRPLVSNQFYPVPDDLNVNDRDYLAWCQKRTEGWYVSVPALGRITRKPFFNISRCRTGADGSPQGAITVSLHPQYFSNFYRQMVSAEPGMRIALARSDGVVLARHPDIDADMDGLLGAKDAALLALLKDNGQANREADTGPLVAIKRLDPYALRVAVSLDRGAVLAQWQSRLAVLAAATFPAGLALAYVASVALRRASRELLAVRRLNVESGQRQRAEAALRHSQKLEALGQLTGGVAHDFNNLLMVVNTNAYLMEQLYPAAKESKPLAAIKRAVVAGTKLTRQLLAFSRRQALRPETVRLQEALPALVDLLQTTVGGAVQLSIEIAPDTHALVVDPAELELALLNLTINARDAMPDGGQLIISAKNLGADELAAASSTLNAPAIELVVTDTGAGIPGAIQDRIFEPFFTTKAPGEGTGLGLSQVYGFCAQAKGEVRVKSAVGEGTSVLIRLPADGNLAKPDGSPAAPAATPASVASAAPASRDIPELAAKVMLVEDNPDVAQATRDLLVVLGCHVTHVDNADRAYGTLRAGHQNFDLVISDVVMPGQASGMDLALMVQRDYPHLAVLLMTGYTRELVRAIEANIPVLPKPFEAKMLLQAMQGALKKVGSMKVVGNE